MDDASRLDVYARTLSAATTRRAALRLLAGGALGAVLPRFSADEAAAACVRAGKRLKHGQRCCPNAARSGGRCVCRSDDAAGTCTGRCGTVQDNCGRAVDCGNTCAGTDTCGGGGAANVCGCTPEPRATTCSGRCGAEKNNCSQDVYCGICAGGGCFVAGTRVAMADGTSRPIELVEAGDRVLGRDGRVNHVLAVHRPLLGDRHLYALNGGPFFVTAGHPIWSATGWKAVDPGAAAAEVPQLTVGRLTVGDQLLVLAAAAVPALAGHLDGDDALDVEQGPLLLSSLEGRPADPATPLYNLHLDGDHTYFADDLLVHNKYF
ncbi:MAG: Hint domain-containing homing endonuclease [Gaiellales bacterium]